MINKLSNHDGNDIEVLPDGSWTPLEAKKENDEPPKKVFELLFLAFVVLLYVLTFWFGKDYLTYDFM